MKNNGFDRREHLRVNSKHLLQINYLFVSFYLFLL